VTDTAWAHQREVREALYAIVSDSQLGTPALSRIPSYLWTLPTQRVILIANDQAAGATYTSLGSWWSRLSYG
jgi:hypothetical protein